MLLGYLQSRDVHAQRLAMDHLGAIVPISGESPLQLIGFFSDCAGPRAMLYRRDGALWLRLTGSDPINLTGASAVWTASRTDALFTITRAGAELLHLTYPLHPDIGSIDSDPTPFIEAEDFDFFLFIRNVVEDQARAERLFQPAAD